MFKAGFSRVDITPRVGVELYGFGPYRHRYSIGIRDILEARAAAFSQDGKSVVIVTNDLCTIDVEIVADARRIVRERHPELSDADIMVEASHTHSGPSTSINGHGWGEIDEPYLRILPHRIAKAACEALDALEEVNVSQAEVPCRHIGLNRVRDVDSPPLEDVLKEDWEPAKPELTDTTCRVIRFDDAKGNLKGFMAYFGCHPVVCCEQSRYIHGDYPGVALHNLMREMPGSIGLFLQGAEGDVNAGCVHKPEQESLLALDVFAARFANAVRHGLQAAKPIEMDVIRSVSKVFRFATRAVFTPELLSKLKSQYEKPFEDPMLSDNSFEARMNTVFLNGIERIEKAFKEGKDKYVEAELQAIKVGPLEFLGAPFEVMQAIKNDIHASVKATYPMLMSLTNGRFGYAPSQDLLDMATVDKGAGGGYESTRVPLINGILPYGDIHHELVQYMTELDAILNP